MTSMSFGDTPDSNMAFTLPIMARLLLSVPPEVKITSAVRTRSVRAAFSLASLKARLADSPDS